MSTSLFFKKLLLGVDRCAIIFKDYYPESYLLPFFEEEFRARRILDAPSGYHLKVAVCCLREEASFFLCPFGEA